jgi:hypothetical protein
MFVGSPNGSQSVNRNRTRVSPQWSNQGNDDSFTRQGMLRLIRLGIDEAPSLDASDQ